MDTTLVQVRCGRCSAVNRVDPARAAAAVPRCGRCKEVLQLPASGGKPLEADDRTFDELVTRAGVPVLVDFWAEWCGPCRGMEPTLAAFAREGLVKVVKVNIDRAPATAQRYQVRAVPTLMLFRGAQELGRQPGAMGIDGLRAFVKRSVGPG